MEPASDELEDLQMPGLNRMSSVNHPASPEYKIVADEIYEVHVEKKQGKKYINEYEVLERLGEGSFGKVYKVERTFINEGKEQKALYAMKVFNRKQLRRNFHPAPDLSLFTDQKLVEIELNILKRLEHKNIIRCFQIIDDDSNPQIFVVMELCDLGSIMVYDEMKEQYVHNQKVLSYLKEIYGTEDRIQLAKFIFRQMFEAVKYLHDKNISNRDIKSDNMMFMKGLKGTECKMIDFSTARYSDNDLSYHSLGTPIFRGPEHIDSDQGYSPKASDIWSLGVTIYHFVFGQFPFVQGNEQSDFEKELKCKNNELSFPEGAPEDLKELLTKMLKKNWKQRPTIDQVMSFGWAIPPQ